MGYKIRDGDIYKIAVISDNRFTIRYGYLSDAEREKWEPTPYIPILYPSLFTRQTGSPLQQRFRIFVSISKSNLTITAKAGVITAYTLISERITSAFANAAKER